jgi:hypothetical protein
MVDSISGGSTPSLLSALMADVTAKQNLEVALIKKSQDVQKMQGEAAVKLIEAASVPPQGGIDVRA